jgi:hypothetical protein
MTRIIRPENSLDNAVILVTPPFCFPAILRDNLATGRANSGGDVTFAQRKSRGERPRPQSME